LKLNLYNALIGCWFARRLASQRNETIPKKRGISLICSTARTPVRSSGAAAAADKLCRSVIVGLKAIRRGKGPCDLRNLIQELTNYHVYAPCMRLCKSTLFEPFFPFCGTLCPPTSLRTRISDHVASTSPARLIRQDGPIVVVFFSDP
jgi:hypothetical protein